jgi:hypothetical protein
MRTERRRGERRGAWRRGMRSSTSSSCPVERCWE